MQPRRKNSNKENGRQPKRTPLATLHSLACTDDLRLPYHSTELKHIIKTLDLRKPTSGNPYKKAVSRKSNSKSAKHNPSYQPPKLKCLMKQFKELKLLHENERSKSRSPVSCKSRSMEKHLPKKQSLATFTKISRNSEPNLSMKLERTMKRLNETNFFREEDSLIPLSSSSEFSHLQKGQVLVTESDEIVDLGQVRQFCSTATLSFKKPESIAFKNFDLFKQTMAALKIQRAWKNYQTKRLISRYTFLSKHQKPSPPLDTICCEPFQPKGPYSSIGSSKGAQQPIIWPEICREFDQDGADQQSSDFQELLGQRAEGFDEEDVVEQMKRQQLQKWSQIVEIISNCQKEGAQSLEQLLEKLAHQSELNKRDLQHKITSMLGPNSPQKSTLAAKPHVEHRIEHHRNRSSSSQSQGMQEYDSKKYIDYLDGDIFVEEKTEPLPQSLAKLSHRISEQQQQDLLNELTRTSHRYRIGQSLLLRSESSKLLELAQEARPGSRQGLRKSSSEKYLHRSLSQMNGTPVEEGEEEINLDLLTKQFLEGSDPQLDNFDLVYSEERLRSKLAELNRFKHEQPGNYEEEQEDGAASVDPECNDQIIPDKKSTQSEIKIEEGQSSPNLQVVEEEISSSSEGDLTEQRCEKSETVTAILMNTLIVELLKQIANSEPITRHFKAYSLSLRPKVRKAEGKRKRGFPTNKAQIELFLEGLLAYLEKQEPTVFANLEIATGPSAIEMLKYMHQYEEEPQDDQSSQDESNVMVVPNRIFDTYWSLKEKAIVIEVPEGYDQNNQLVFRHQFELLKSFNKIFYRSLFDTFNECLDYERNFGPYGKPFPWKRTPAFSHHKTHAQLQSSVQRARTKMLELSTTYCGLIVEHEEMLTISQEYVDQVHEDRLSRMLAADLLEGEERWVFYDDQETEILVEVANAIYTELLIELIEALYDIE